MAKKTPADRSRDRTMSIASIEQDDIGSLVAFEPSQVQRSKPSPVFARHETFHPRFGWIKKGYDKAVQNPSVFIQDDAPAVLGVGKNMVQSIRYWTTAFKVLVETPQPGSQGRVSAPTDFGRLLIGEGGWDPYLEDPASLWLLHWNLVRQPSHATTWDYVFNSFRRAEFTSDDILTGIAEHTQREFPKSRVVQSSLKKDVHCLLRMYAEARGATASSEETIDSPFAELGLIRSSSDGRYFYFNMGEKSTLSPEIVTAACLEYIEDIDQQASSVSLSKLLYEPGSPGLVFKLTESSLYAALEAVARKFSRISIKDTAGIVQLAFTGQASHLTDALLDQYYKRKRR